MHHSRRSAVLVAALALLILLTTAASAARADQSVSVPVVHIEGRGHGHGVGMSQWGAFTMAQGGASTADIIGSFYPGTQLASLAGEVVVVVDQRDRITVQIPAGGEIRSARSGPQQAGFPVSVPPGGTVTVVRDQSGYHVAGGAVRAAAASSPTRYSAPADCVLFVCEPDDPPPTAPPPPTTTTTTAPPPDDGDGSGGGPLPADPAPPEQRPAPPSEAVSSTPVWAVPAGNGVVRSVDRDRSYRGLLEIDGGPGALRARNHVDVEDYLKGMAEVPGSWPPAAVQAQAIAARTYALRAMAAGGQLCDTDACQVYGGAAHESAGQVAAVDATRGLVVTYGGGLAATFYSASGGGITANVAEGFGSPSDVPYLQVHPYQTVHPDEWAVDVALSDVGRRLGYPGTVRAVRIDQVGPSGRPLQMTLDGDAGPRGVDPQDFRRRLGLRSTLFSVRGDELAAAPPPPPEEADPGVVGAIADGGRSGSWVGLRLGTTTSAAIDVPAAAGRSRTPVLLVAAAIVLVALAWAEATLGVVALAPIRTATMSRWTNRSH